MFPLHADKGGALKYLWDTSAYSFSSKQVGQVS